MNYNRAFHHSIELAQLLVRKANLLGDINKNVHIPVGYISTVRDLSYQELWQYNNENFFYHIKLTDESLIFFQEDSFKYSMCPYESFMSYDEFESEQKRLLAEDGYSEEDIDSLLGDSLTKDFQNYLETDVNYRIVTPLRVDIHPEQYREMHHPLTHLHVGFSNKSRIPIKRIMTPYAFTAFVISTFYPEHWIELLQSGTLSDNEWKQMNEHLRFVHYDHDNKWHPIFEENRFYLT